MTLLSNVDRSRHARRAYQLKSGPGLIPGQLPSSSRVAFPVLRRKRCSIIAVRMKVTFCKTQRVPTRSAAPGAPSPAQRAFTIAEVLVAVFVLGIACISLYAGFATGFMLVDSTRQELRATQILTQKAEALRLCTWSSLTNFPLTFSESYDPTSTNNQSILYVGTVTTDAASVIPNSAAYQSNMCVATINLYWTNFSGGQKIVHNRTSQTMIARYGIQNYIWGN